MKEREEHFLKNAIKAASAILEPLGFKVRKENELEYYAESDKMQIYIAHARTTVKTSVGILGESYYGLVELHWILEALVPEMDESDRFPKQAWSNEEIRTELCRQLLLLVEYCKPLLEGNPTDWVRIQDFMHNLGGMRQNDNELDEHYIIRLYNIAAAAWGKKEYWKLNGIYTLLAVRKAKLTLKDHYRWFQARRHTFLIG